MTHDYFKRYVDFYRERHEQHRSAGRHSGPAGGIVGAGGLLFVRPRSQDAIREFRPYYSGHPVLSSAGSMETAIANTGMNVGSPAEVVEQILAQGEYFGDYQRHLFGVDGVGKSEAMTHEQLELIGAEVLPALRKALGPAIERPAHPITV